MLKEIFKKKKRGYGSVLHIIGCLVVGLILLIGSFPYTFPLRFFTNIRRLAKPTGRDIQDG